MRWWHIVVSLELLQLPVPCIQEHKAPKSAQFALTATLRNALGVSVGSLLEGPCAGSHSGQLEAPCAGSHSGQLEIRRGDFSHAKVTLYVKGFPKKLLGVHYVSPSGP